MERYNYAINKSIQGHPETLTKSTKIYIPVNTADVRVYRLIREYNTIGLTIEKLCDALYVIFCWLGLYGFISASSLPIGPTSVASPKGSH